MRPIDADALLKGKEDHEMISTHLIFNAPTLDVKPVIKGKWNFTRHYKDVYVLCSVCGAERKYDLTDNWYFCPNCGADMRESEDR